MRRGGGVVERVGLENRSTRKGTVGSNPTLSATPLTEQNPLRSAARCRARAGVKGRRRGFRIAGGEALLPHVLTFFPGGLSTERRARRTIRRVAGGGSSAHHSATRLRTQSGRDFAASFSQFPTES